MADDKARPTMTMIGKTLGTYEVVAKLGEGAMGEVCRARDTKLDRDVALKILPESIASDPDRLMCFECGGQLIVVEGFPEELRRRVPRGMSVISARVVIAVVAAIVPSLLIASVASAQATGMPTAERNLRRLDITLPAPSKPGGNYVSVVRVGNLLFLSASGPGPEIARGKVGKDVTPEEAYRGARSTGLNVLATIRAEIGSLDKVKRIVRVVGMVNTAPGFTNVPQIVNGFSDLMVAVFGEAIGKHARSAVGVAELPNNVPVAIEVILEVQ